MTEILNSPDYIFRSILFIIGIGFIITGLFGLYSYWKKKSDAIFTIPVRRFYVLVACLVVINAVFLNKSQSDFYLLFGLSIFMVSLFLSAHILVLNDGIYSFMRLTRWEEINDISTDFMTLWLHTNKGIFKKIGYAKFVWKFDESYIEQLKTILADKKTAERIKR